VPRSGGVVEFADRRVEPVGVRRPGEAPVEEAVDERFDAVDCTR